ncbi:hypothetical protein E2542_SST25155 [Spatholobus suberectus]|nr:hypothetical protein E2542_SST25155 [Spatholobus suberectus]
MHSVNSLKHELLIHVQRLTEMQFDNRDYSRTRALLEEVEKEYTKLIQKCRHRMWGKEERFFKDVHVFIQCTLAQSMVLGETALILIQVLIQPAPIFSHNMDTYRFTSGLAFCWGLLVL